jgi:exopolyphosphatase/guanosine-5'-triphosphate,3'-diphosphate pyrophosphatase
VRVAAVDCGTNSVRLLVADLDAADGSQVDLDRRMRIVRLGEGVDAAGRLAPQAVARLLDACDDYAEVIAGHDVARVRFCATSAARDAGDRALVEAGVRERLGVPMEVISGDEEARLTAAGAVRGVHGIGLALPHLVVDIGGGSTELAVVDAAATGDVHSVPVGSVRLTERLLGEVAAGEPAADDRLAAVRAEVDRALRTVWPDGAPPTAPASVVVVGGTAVTVAGFALGLPLAELEATHRERLPLDTVLHACDRLARMPVAERTALACMHPGRADVIGAGALVLERVLHAVRPGLAGHELVVSTHDILDGIAWSVVA